MKKLIVIQMKFHLLLLSLLISLWAQATPSIRQVVQYDPGSAYSTPVFNVDVSFPSATLAGSTIVVFDRLWHESCHLDECRSFCR
jgi:hypothetical protein